MSAAQAPLLALSRARAGYDGSAVLHEVDLTVAPGEIVALLGRNGAGKSTAVATIAGTLPLSRGQVRIAGDDCTSLGPARRYAAGLRVVRQSQPVFGSLTVADNLALVGCKDVGKAAGVFAFLTDRGRQVAGTLSGGEQKMLAMARVFVEPGRVWVLDEPTEGLQPSNVDRCAELIAFAAAKGVGVLLVEQHIEMAMRVANRWQVLERGRIVDGGTVSEASRDAISSHISI